MFISYFYVHLYCNLKNTHMENKDLYHYLNQFDSFWDFHPIDLSSLNDDNNTVNDDCINYNKQEQINYF